MHPKIDKRSAKTISILKRSLVALLTTRNINDITIKELVNTANINRSTFYLHYSDIFNLLDDLENDILKATQQILDSYPSLSNDTSFNFVADLLNMFETNKPIFKALLGEYGDFLFVRKLEALVEGKVRKQINFIYNDNICPAPSYIYDFVRSGCVGMLKSWLYYDKGASPEEMAKFVHETVLAIIGNITK